MWIREFYKRFSEATETYTGRVQNLEAVEREVREVCGEGQITSEVLLTIEKSQAWGYSDWWLPQSRNFGPLLVIPSDLASPETQQRLVSALFERLKHIEVTSVVLRFVRPHLFGIFSPPVAHLLALPAGRDHVRNYLQYLQILEEFAKHYEPEWRVADVDMALWSAVHLLAHYPALAEEMYDDEFFQRVRLSNLLEDLGRHWRKTDRHRILLAESLLKTDYSMAACVGAKVFESWVRVTHEALGLPTPIRKRYQSLVGAFIDQFKRTPELERFGITGEDIGPLWERRNLAVHEDETITKNEAKQFVDRVRHLVVEPSTPA